MSSSITYLVGAGASAKALPTVDAIPAWMEGLIIKLSSILKLSDQQIVHKNNTEESFKIIEEIKTDLSWLLSQVTEHASVDTLAKKFYIQKKWGDFARLKSALSIFFILIEADGKVDIRYDSFFASILNEDHITLPENIKILSWNYDNQFEKGYAVYSDNKSLRNARLRLGYLSKNIHHRKMQSVFSLIKLNGHCGFVNRNNSTFDFSDQIPITSNKDDLASIYASYYERLKIPTGEYQSSLNFAWENKNEEQGNDSFIQDVIKKISNTGYLVIIGYSFPFFNRSVDNKILNSMSKLQKVYIQSPEAVLLKDKLKSIIAIDEGSIIPVLPDEKNFFLPPQM